MQSEFCSKTETHTPTHHLFNTWNTISLSLYQKSHKKCPKKCSICGFLWTGVASTRSNCVAIAHTANIPSIPPNIAFCRVAMDDEEDDDDDKSESEIN